MAPRMLEAEMSDPLDKAVAPLPDAVAQSGWKLVPVEPTRDWSVALAERRIGQRNVPQCEPPTPSEIELAHAAISDVLASAPVPPSRKPR